MLSLKRSVYVCCLLVILSRSKTKFKLICLFIIFSHIVVVVVSVLVNYFGSKVQIYKTWPFSFIII